MAVVLCSVQWYNPIALSNAECREKGCMFGCSFSGAFRSAEAAVIQYIVQYNSTRVFCKVESREKDITVQS